MYPEFKTEDQQDLSHIDVAKFEHLFNYEIHADRIKLSISHTKESKCKLGVALKVSEEASWKDIKNNLQIAKQGLIKQALDKGYLDKQG